MLGDVSTTVTAGLVGTKGVTSYDGNIFGGGRDYMASNHTNGRVGGNVKVKMTGGRLMGTIFGGGRLALTGVDVDGDVSDFMITEDGKQVFDSANHGLVRIDVSSGFIGNPDGETLLNGDGSEHSSDESNGDIFGSGKGDTRYYDDVLYGRVMNTIINVTGNTRVFSSIYGGGEMAGVGWWGANGAFVPRTGTSTVNVKGTTTKVGSDLEYDASYLASVSDNDDDWTYMVDGKLVHACTGNVVGGSQGDVDLYSPHWVSFGRSRQTYVNISETPTIMGNVYGGAEQGIVTENAHVTVTGGTIGTDITGVAASLSPTGHYYFGGVYGGGYGSERYWNQETNDVPTVDANTGDTLKENGVVVTHEETTYFYHDSCVFSATPHTLENMNHYIPATMFAGRVYGKTYVDISGGTIRENVFGGGNMASVGYVERDDNGEELLSDATKRHQGVCNVKITGKAIIGPLDGTGHNACVFGAGKGVNSDPEENFKRYCNVNEAHLFVNLDFESPEPYTEGFGWNSSTDGRIYGSLFGGGGDCHVLGDVSTTFSGGLLGTQGVTNYDGNIFGGGRDYMNTNHTNGRVQGNIGVLVNGGFMMGTIFGGGRMALSGIDVDGHYISEEHGNVSIWVSGKSIIGTNQPVDLLSSDQSCGDIFGAGKGDCDNYEDIWSGRVNNSRITVKDTLIESTTYSPTIHGGVFGGGEMASLGYWDDVIRDDDENIVFHTTSSDFTTPGVTYGNDWGTFYANSGNAFVKITGGATIGTRQELEYTESDNPGNWTIYKGDGKILHTCTGNVYGGSQGDIDVEAPHWVSMGRSYSSQVIIGDGTDNPKIRGCVFGGAEQGIVTGNTMVTINSGTIGTHVTVGSGAGEGNDYIYGDVYAAGYGCDGGDAEWNDVTPNDSTAGSEGLGVGWNPGLLAGRTFGNSRVDVLGGLILGSVYGGGSFASVGDDKPGYTVYGETTVNIGLPDPENEGDAIGSATIEGGVFGANNYKGTPYGNTNVHIYKTAHTSGTSYPDIITKNAIPVVDGNHYPLGLKSLADPDDEISLEDFALLIEVDSASLSLPGRFALKEVYGGGNMASHTPIDDDGSTLVHVHYCEENTICDLYGGGNAADTKNNKIIVDGGRIHRVFGGGNGAGAGNPGADVSGTADTRIYGGFIDYVFGGSNALGDIGTVLLTIEDNIEDNEIECPVFVLNAFGGSNDSPTESDIVTTIGCGARGVNFYGGSNNATIGNEDNPIDVTLNINGGVFTNIYGGSKGTFPNPYDDIPDVEQTVAADIHGNVTVNYYDGTVERIYGGSHQNGNIYGKITVNVYFDHDPNCGDGQSVDYVFGGGEMAIYTPNDHTILSPEVNIYKGLINNEVYGGGRGVNDEYGVFQNAKVTSNPLVRIGPEYLNPKTGKVEYNVAIIGFSTIPSDYPDYNSTTGSATFDAKFPLVNGTRYIGSNGNVFGGGNGSPTDGSTKVYILNNSHVFGGVYGGGNNAEVSGNTDVIIGE